MKGIRWWGTLYPAAALIGIVSDISCRSSLDSFTRKEPIFSSVCLVLVVPEENRRLIVQYDNIWLKFRMLVLLVA